MLLVLWMVTGSLNFYVLSHICYWRLWTSVSEFYGVLRVMDTVFWFIIGLYYLKKKFTFVHLSSLHCFVFYKDWVFVFFFNPWIDIYTIITISFLVNVFSFWMERDGAVAFWIHRCLFWGTGLVSLVVSSFQALLINCLSFCRDFVVRRYYYYYYYYWCCHMYKLSLWFVFYHT